MGKTQIKYHFDNWNKYMLQDPVKAHKFISHMLQGNMYAFMNKLLDFEYIKEIDMYGPKKERKFGARRTSADSTKVV